MQLRPALFLTRDGVVIESQDCIRDLTDVQWVNGVVETVKAFNYRGWYVFVVTNQPSIAQGLLKEEEVIGLHNSMTSWLGKSTAKVDHFYYCPYDEEGSVIGYKKQSFDKMPKPVMLLKAMADYPVDRASSFMICNIAIEMKAAKDSGIQGFLFRGGNLYQFTEWVFADISGGTR